MPLYLNDDQAMLKDTVARFRGRTGPDLAQLRHLRDSADATGFSRDLWKQFAELGLTGILFPRRMAGSAWGMSRRGSCSRRSAAT